MYAPRYFREENEAVLLEFIGQHSFATLVSTAPDGRLLASHVPLELRTGADAPALVGHLSRANEQWRTFEAESDVLAIFQGPDAYISPTWYDHTNVPTWNYAAVHVYGRPRIIGDQRELLELVSEQVARYETAPSEYRVESLPPDFVRKELRGIVGFEIPIARIESSFKLSQNRHEADYDNVIERLEERSDTGSRAVAGLMRQRCPHRQQAAEGDLGTARRLREEGALEQALEAVERASRPWSRDPDVEGEP